MECTKQVNYQAASWCSNGTCVEPGFHRTTNGSDCGQVHVRNSQFPGLVVDVPLARWRELVVSAQASDEDEELDLKVWFPPAQYGDFAATFTEAERAAFEQGILAGEPQLTGPTA